MIKNSPSKEKYSKPFSNTTENLDGFGDIYKTYWQDLCRFLQAHFGSPPDPEDIAQDAFLNYMVACQQATIDNPKAYLFKIAHNLEVDYRLRRKKDVLVTAQSIDMQKNTKKSDALGPEYVSIFKEQCFLLKKAILALPQRERSFVLMNRWENVTYTEIAKKTGMSRSGVQKVITRALERCRGYTWCG